MHYLDVDPSFIILRRSYIYTRYGGPYIKKSRIKPGFFLASSLKYFIVQEWPLLLSEVNEGYVLVMYLQKRTAFSGGLACAIIKG